MSEVKNLIDAIESENGAEVSRIFNDEMSSRISTLLDAKKKEIASRYAEYNVPAENEEVENEEEVIEPQEGE